MAIVASQVGALVVHHIDETDLANSLHAAEEAACSTAEEWHARHVASGPFVQILRPDAHKCFLDSHAHQIARKDSEMRAHINEGPGPDFPTSVRPVTARWPDSSAIARAKRLQESIGNAAMAELVRQTRWDGQMSDQAPAETARKSPERAGPTNSTAYPVQRASGSGTEAERDHPEVDADSRGDRERLKHLRVEVSRRLRKEHGWNKTVADGIDADDLQRELDEVEATVPTYRRRNMVEIADLIAHALAHPAVPYPRILGGAVGVEVEIQRAANILRLPTEIRTGPPQVLAHTDSVELIWELGRKSAIFEIRSKPMAVLLQESAAASRVQQRDALKDTRYAADRLWAATEGAALTSVFGSNPRWTVTQLGRDVNVGSRAGKNSWGTQHTVGYPVTGLHKLLEDASSNLRLASHNPEAQGMLLGGNLLEARSFGDRITTLFVAGSDRGNSAPANFDILRQDYDVMALRGFSELVFTQVAATASATVHKERPKFATAVLSRTSLRGLRATLPPTVQGFLHEKRDVVLRIFAEHYLDWTRNYSAIGSQYNPLTLRVAVQGGGSLTVEQYFDNALLEHGTADQGAIFSTAAFRDADTADGALDIPLIVVEMRNYQRSGGLARYDALEDVTEHFATHSLMAYDHAERARGLRVPDDLSSTVSVGFQRAQHSLGDGEQNDTLSRFAAFVAQEALRAHATDRHLTVHLEGGGNGLWAGRVGASRARSVRSRLEPMVRTELVRRAGRMAGSVVVDFDEMTRARTASGFFGEDQQRAVIVWLTTTSAM
jgi:hypothetical protein